MVSDEVTPTQSQSVHVMSLSTILIVDYNSAFNTNLVQKSNHTLVYDLKFQLEICNLILDFLLYRPQIVQINIGN